MNLRQLSRIRRLTASVVAMLFLTACSSSQDDDNTGDGLSDVNQPGNSATSQPSPSIDAVPQVLPQETTIGAVYSFGENSQTLYTRPSDTPNAITCTDVCAQSFAPVTTEVTQTGISGQFDVIARNDGSTQWMLKGYPLYFFAGDAAAAEINGQGTDGEWFVARPDPITSGDTSLGETLVASGSTITSGSDAAMRNNFDGHTLYIFANDTTGVSNCNDGCSNTWAPLYADVGALGLDPYSIITRTDNTRQWAYQGSALYFFSGDTNPGDINGNGVDGLWSAVTQ